MFKKAVISDEISQDIDKAVEMAAMFKLEGIEIRSVFGKDIHELNEAERNKIFTTIRAENMVIPCLATPIFKCQIDDDEQFKKNIDILKKSIKIAQEWNVNMIRGFTFWKKENFEEVLPKIIEKISTVIPLLQENNILMVIESDPHTNTNSTQKLKMLLDQLNSKWIKALWDPANNIYVEDAERPYPESYETIKEYIGHIHVKDAIRNSQGNVDSCCIETGEVNWTKIIRRLITDNYNGFLSLETHYRLNKTIPQHLLDRPKGYAFSCFGEEASIECLKSWNRIMNNIELSESFLRR